MRGTLVTEIIGGEPYEYYPMGDYVVRAKGICGGRPTFKYTRIEVARILGMLVSDSIDSVVKDYGGRLSREAILEAVKLAHKPHRKSSKLVAA